MNSVNQGTIILLQTPDAKIVNNKNCHYVAKVLFDSCSQQTYISEKVVRKLKLMALSEINVGVKVLVGQFIDVAIGKNRFLQYLNLLGRVIHLDHLIY